MAVNTWRKDLFSKIKRQISFLRERRVEFPEILEFVTGAKGNMFEFGGQDHSSGVAMIVAAPSGKPGQARILHRRWANELHAAIQIWPGCLVALGSHHMGAESMAIYSIVDAKNQNDFEFGSVLMKRLAYKTPVTHSGISPDNWYETESITVDVADMVAALKKKLYTYNCEDPVFLEWFHEIKKTDKGVLLKNSYDKGTNGKLKIGKLGIDEPNIQYTGLCTDFESYMREIRNVADDLNENFQSKFVYIHFAYHLNEDDHLVCQARHFHNNDGPYFALTPYHTLYTIVIDSQDKMDGMFAFLNKYNPEYRQIIFGVSGLGVVMSYLNSHKENTVSNFTKYAKCTSRPTYFERKPVEQPTPKSKKSKPVVKQEEQDIDVDENDDTTQEEYTQVHLLKSTDPKGTFLLDNNYILIDKKFKLSKPILLGLIEQEHYTPVIEEIRLNTLEEGIISIFDDQAIEVAVDEKTGHRIQTNTLVTKFADKYKIILEVKFTESGKDSVSVTISSKATIESLDEAEVPEDLKIVGYKLSAYYAN